MSDRRDVLRALLLGAAGLAVPSGLAACGVPSGGRPVVVGAGPSAGTGRAAPEGKPLGPEGASSPTDLVQRYLLAVAGPLDSDDYVKRAQNFARKFMVTDLQADWQPDNNVTVVQVGELKQSDGINSTFVEGKLQPVGSLNSSGSLVPPGTPAAQLSCTFEVVVNPERAGGFRIKRITAREDKNIANHLLLSSKALDVDAGLGLYTPQLLYYWSAAGRDGLIPDLRYLPADNIPRQLARIVSDLLSEPQPWLEANSLASLKLLGAGVTYNQDAPLVINFLPPVPDAGRLMTLLRWSLWPIYQNPVQLQVNSQTQQIEGANSAFKQWNLADAARSGDEFCVAGGVVQPLGGGSAPAVLDAPLNSKVVWAALSRDKGSVAVVREAGAGRYGLWLGADRASDYGRVSGLPQKTTNVTRPVWLPGQARVLVLADNHLYAADLASRVASDVTPSGVNRITAFSVAPDGRRIALIADGGAAIAALNATGLGPPQPLNVTLLQGNTLSAIAWTRLDRVVLAGRPPGSNNTLVEMTIDGAVARQLTDVSLAEEITHLTGFPPTPSIQNTGMGKVLGQSGRDTKAYSFEYTALRGYNRVPQIQVSPSPAPSASPGHQNLVTPLSLFFAD
jgi:hypothetical protein